MEDRENPEIEIEEEEIDLEDLLSLDALDPRDASKIARDLTVAWIQNNKYEDNLSEEEVAVFYKSLYQAARFPTLFDEDGDDALDDLEEAEADDAV